MYSHEKRIKIVELYNKYDFYKAKVNTQHLKYDICLVCRISCKWGIV
jgi:hypothetical protein